jgi:hypothetical protein
MNDRDWLLPKRDVSAGAVLSAADQESIGVHAVVPATCPFDPGYDPLTAGSWAIVFASTRRTRAAR